jgi:hypothetical protein
MASPALDTIEDVPSSFNTCALSKLINPPHAKGGGEESQV